MQRRRATHVPSAEGLKAVDLSFHVFDRSIHPELFSVRQGIVLERDDFQARIYLTSVGHLCSFAWGKQTLTQTLCPASQPLPKKRERLRRKLSDGAADQRTLVGGAGYSFTLGVRLCTPGEFVELQQEALHLPKPQLIDAGERPDRWHGLRSLSWMRYELTQKSLEVHAFHALPSDFALVETTSRFLLPSK